MKTLLTTDVQTREVSVEFPGELSDMNLVLADRVISLHELSEHLYPTPCIGVALEELSKHRKQEFQEILDELFADKSMSHGSASTYVHSLCRGPLCSFAVNKKARGQLARTPEVTDPNWMLWHVILSHRLYQKVVRKARIEIW